MDEKNNPKKHTSDHDFLKESLNESKDLLQIAEDFRAEIQQIRSELRRFDKTYEEEVKRDPVYQHLQQLSDLTVEDDELAQRIYKSRVRDYKGTRQEPLRTGDMVNRGRKIYLKVFGEDEEDKKPEPDARYRPKEVPSLQQQSRLVQDVVDSYKDFESYLGENFATIAGITMVVIGVIMLLNYGISEGFITNLGQLFIGFATGGSLVYLSHTLRHKSQTWSGIVLIGGMIILYYSAALLFEYYSVSSQILAYAINLFITLIAVVLAIAHNRQRLALVSIIGGYVTAFVVARLDTTNYFALFAYLLLLNIIALGIAYYKEWQNINVFTFITSLILFDGWVFSHDPNTGNNATTALTFATLYYITFFLMNIVYSMGTRQRLKNFNYKMLLANVVSYLIIVVYVLYRIDDLAHTGTFMFGLAVFNSIYSYLLYKSDSADVKLFYTVTGYTIAFFTIAIPLLVDKEFINVCFVFEALLLIWVGTRSQMTVFKTTSMIVMSLSMIVWFFDLYWTYENELTRRFVLNNAVLSSLLTMVGLALSIYLLRKEDEEEDIGFINVGMYTNFIGGFMLFILFTIGNIELIIHKSSNFGGNDFRLILIGLFNILYALGVWAFSKTVKWFGIEQLMGIMIFIMLFAYFALVQPSAMDLLLEHARSQVSDTNWLTNSHAMSQYLVHYFNLGITLFALFLLVRNVYYEQGENSVVYGTTIYMFCFGVVSYLSMELRNTVVWLFYDYGDNLDSILETNSQFGYPILWACFSIVAISAGMRYKIKEVRLFALILFVVLLVKFFAWDFWRMGTIEGIIAFVLIGAILLRIGWKYNQLKKIVMEGQLADIYKNVPEQYPERQRPTGRISSERKPTKETKNEHKIGVRIDEEDRKKEADELADLPPPFKPKASPEQRPPSEEEHGNKLD